LITESAQVFAEDLTLSSIRVAREQFRDPQQMQRLSKYHGDKAAWVVDAWTENWLDPEFESWSLLQTLERVKCPVMALHGEHDEYGTAHHPRLIGQSSGGPRRVEILAATAHVPHREQEEQVLSLVSDFLRPAEPSPRR
jgi:pimeloyl-ACP methyl ester carboxylesterase